MPGRRIKALAGPLLAVLALAGLEVVARAVLVLFPAIGDPWSGGAAAPLNGDFVRQMEFDAGVVPERQQLYVRDRTLFWRLAPNVDLQVENSAFRVRDGPLRWTIHTDHRGFRSPAVPVERTGLRILTLGDSCTFGFRVNDADTYPARLMRACAAHAPGGRVHVLDASVGQHGLRLRHLRDAAPIGIGDVGLHDDHPPPDVQRPRHGLDAAATHRPKEIRLRLDRGRGGARRQVQEGADRPERVAERHEGRAVEHATRRAALRRPVETATDLVGDGRRHLDAERARERHGLGDGLRVDGHAPSLPRTRRTTLRGMDAATAAQRIGGAGRGHVRARRKAELGRAAEEQRRGALGQCGDRQRRVHTERGRHRRAPSVTKIPG